MFAESVSLSSTTLADHRLPPAAFEIGFDLLALRARRVRESTRARPRVQGPAERKSPQIRHVVFSGAWQLSRQPRRTVQISATAENNATTMMIAPREASPTRTEMIDPPTNAVTPAAIAPA